MIVGQTVTYTLDTLPMDNLTDGSSCAMLIVLYMIMSCILTINIKIVRCNIWHSECIFITMDNSDININNLCSENSYVGIIQMLVSFMESWLTGSHLQVGFKFATD